MPSRDGGELIGFAAQVEIAVMSLRPGGLLMGRLYSQGLRNPSGALP